MDKRRASRARRPVKTAAGPTGHRRIDILPNTGQETITFQTTERLVEGSECEQPVPAMSGLEFFGQREPMKVGQTLPKPTQRDHHDRLLKRKQHSLSTTRHRKIVPLPISTAIRSVDQFGQVIMSAAFHNTAQYANNRVECDHGRLKARLRPMRGLKRDHSAHVIMRGHALMQNIRRGHYELGVDTRPHQRVETTFTELARTI